MVNSSKRFKPIQRLASEKERKAAVALGDASRQCLEAERRLADLRAYQAEYLERYRATARAGASAARLRDYQVFLERLEEAVAEQQRVLEAALAERSRTQDRWRDQHQRTQSMQKTVDRLRRDEQREADRREQGEQDERGQRRR